MQLAKHIVRTRNDQVYTTVCGIQRTNLEALLIKKLMAKDWKNAPICHDCQTLTILEKQLANQEATA